MGNLKINIKKLWYLMAYEGQNKNQILKLLGNNEDKMKRKIFLFYFFLKIHLFEGEREKENVHVRTCMRVGGGGGEGARIPNRLYPECAAPHGARCHDSESLTQAKTKSPMLNQLPQDTPQKVFNFLI